MRPEDELIDVRSAFGRLCAWLERGFRVAVGVALACLDQFAGAFGIHDGATTA